MMNDLVKNFKVGIAAICKDEQHIIENFILKHQHFDELILVDTGSTDNTKSIVQKYPNVVLYEATFAEINFSNFRNELWKKLLENHSSLDFVIILDCDELLLNSIDNVKSFLSVQPLNKVAFNINRSDICLPKNDITRLKRVLRLKSGKWLRSVHENFIFDDDDSLDDSLLNVIHLETERIKTKGKNQLYLELTYKEYYENENSEYLYFILLNLVSRLELKKVRTIFYSSPINNSGFFHDQILFVFWKVAYLLGDEKFIGDVFKLINSNIGILQKIENFKKFRTQLTIFDNSYDNFGYPVTVYIVLSLAQNLRDMKFINNLIDLFEQVTSSIDLTLLENELTLSFNVPNNIKFYHLYFSKHEIIREFFSCCIRSDVTIDIYFERKNDTRTN